MQDLSQPIEELGGRTWEELEIVTHEDGHLLFKDCLRRRVESGAVERIPVRVKILRTHHIAQARTATRVLFKEQGLDENRDQDLFAELEQVCALAIAVREPEPPYPQMHTAEELVRSYDEASLQDLIGRVQHLRQLIDPRESQLTEEELWHKVFAVAREGHLGPLTDIAGFEQPSCVVFMAVQAMNSPNGQSWLQSIETSTPASSGWTKPTRSSEEATSAT
jgi:hypothetical protein